MSIARAASFQSLQVGPSGLLEFTAQWKESPALRTHERYFRFSAKAHVISLNFQGLRSVSELGSARRIILGTLRAPLLTRPIILRDCTRRNVCFSLSVQAKSGSKSFAKGGSSKQKSEAPEVPSTSSRQDNVAGETEGDDEVSWVDEKFEEVQELMVSVGEKIPGPRVHGSDLPWLVAAPLAYLWISFVWTIVKLVQKQNSPRAKRRRLLNKNAYLNEELQSMFQEGRETLTPSRLKKLANECRFTPAEALRKYIRYSLNEHPFGTDLVADLIHLRAVSELQPAEVADVLNDVSRRVVKQKGAVMMDTTGFTEKGIKRKAAVQGLFSKLLYLSELEQFCSASVHDKLQIKSIFGVTDEDADSIRITSLSESSDLSSLEELMGSEGVPAGERGDGVESKNDES